MKKLAIRTEVESALRTLGFKPKQWRWGGCRLDIVVGGEFRSLRLPSGMAKRDVMRQIGRIEGWVEILAERASGEDGQRTATKINGHIRPEASP